MMGNDHSKLIFFVVNSEKNLVEKGLIIRYI